jgi:hypothetical protein
MFVNFGGEGLDGVSSFLSRVLSEKIEDVFGILFLLQSLYVICNPTAPD